MSNNTEKLADKIKPLLKRAAGLGLVYTYDLLKIQPGVRALVGDNRTRLYDALDAINRETCVDGYLLSAVVISDSGMPGPGFFRKLRNGEWSPLEAPPVAVLPDHEVFRVELTRVFSKFFAPKKVAVFIDLENMSTVQEEVIAAVVRLRSRFSAHTMGFYHPKKPNANWKEENLKKIRRMKPREAHKDAAYKTSAADTVLVGEWRAWVLDGRRNELFPRIILTPRDVVCLFSDDTIYHDSVLKAMDKGFEVWGFGNGDLDTGGREQLEQYRDTFHKRGRFFRLRASVRQEWDFTPKDDG